MADPLSDPRARRLLSTDLSEISTLAGLFHRVAAQSQTAAGGLRGAHAANWTGAAADAFRSKLGKLPGDLDNVEASYAGVAGALDTYGAHLEPIQLQFVSLITELTDARSSLATAWGQVATARANLSTASSAPHATSSTPAVLDAHAALTSANGTAGRLQDQVSGLEGRGFRLLDEFDSVRGVAVGRVSDSGAVAPSHHWWQSVASFVGNFVKDAAVGIGKSFYDLFSGKAIMNFIDHPGWESLGALVKDIAVVASVVAMVAAPFAAPELAEADALEAGAEGAATATETAVTTTGTTVEATDATVTTTETTGETTAEGGRSFGDIARGVNQVGNGTALIGNGIGVVDDLGQGRYGAAALDAGFMIAPNLGSTGKAIGAIKEVDSLPAAFKLIPRAMNANMGFGDDLTNALHVGDDTAKEALANAKNIALYNGLRDVGLDAPLAKKVIFGDGEVPALHADWNAVASRAMHFGRPAAYAFDSLLSDPAKDKLKSHYHMVPENG
ncbi:MAG TPA: hypothetical protein VGI55_19865 [Solirubrobacteraceae bacterium]